MKLARAPVHPLGACGGVPQTPWIRFPLLHTEIHPEHPGFFRPLAAALRVLSPSTDSWFTGCYTRSTRRPLFTGLAARERSVCSVPPGLELFAPGRTARLPPV